jgi:probable HAF family extracellular repeat protein
MKNRYAFTALFAGCLLGLAAASAQAEAPQMISIAPEGALSSFAARLNARGDVIGHADYGSGINQSFFHRNGVTSTLSLGGVESSAYDINDSGQVVGEATNADGEWRGFIYTGGNFIEIPTLPGWERSRPESINNSGQIIGVSWRDSDEYSVYEAFLLTNGESTPITLGGTYTYPSLLNEGGDVLGAGDMPDGQEVCFIHTEGLTIPITLPGGIGGYPVALNEAGDALVNVVTRRFASPGSLNLSYQRSALYHAASGQVIDLSPGGDTRALAMNQWGDVIGHSRETRAASSSTYGFTTPSRAFLYRDGETIDLTPSGATSSFAVLLGENRDVVLRAYVGAGSLAIWRDGAVIPIVLDGYTLFASAMNERGEVVGRAVPVGGSSSTDSLPFLWRDGEFFFVSPGTSIETPLINQRGEVAGNYFDPVSNTSPTYLYRDGLITTFGPLADAGRSFPEIFNERGFIAGTSYPSNNSASDYQAFLIPGNRPPAAGDDLAYGQLNQPVVIPVLLNDSDPELDPLQVTSVTQPAHGTAVRNANGTITYTATATFSGFDSFTYTVSDGFPGTTTATVYITHWAEGLSSSVTAIVQDGAALPAGGKSLLTLLDSAANSSTGGNTTAAVGQLNAFIAQVGAFVKNGKLTAEQGASLVSAAQAVIDGM